MFRKKRKLYERSFRTRQARHVINKPDWFCTGCQAAHAGTKEFNEGSDGNYYCAVAYIEFIQKSGGISFENARPSF